MKNIALITNQEFRIRDYGTDSYPADSEKMFFTISSKSRFYYYEHYVFAFRPVDIKGIHVFSIDFNQLCAWPAGRPGQYPML